MTFHSFLFSSQRYVTNLYDHLERKAAKGGWLGVRGTCCDGSGPTSFSSAEVGGYKCGSLQVLPWRHRFLPDALNALSPPGLGGPGVGGRGTSGTTLPTQLWTWGRPDPLRLGRLSHASSPVALTLDLRGRGRVSSRMTPRNLLPKERTGFLLLLSTNMDRSLCGSLPCNPTSTLPTRRSGNADLLVFEVFDRLK